MRLKPRLNQFVSATFGVHDLRDIIRFEEEYPNAQVGFTCVLGFTKASETAGICTLCRRPASWVSQKLGIFFCSTACFESYQRQGNSFPMSA